MTGTRILVVEDEPKLVRLLREVLTASGYGVLSVGSGQGAVDMIARDRPDLVILDIVLADALDGYAVTRRVREFSDVPILMLTAKARESDLLRGFDAGADDYLTKPFSANELLARVRAMLKRAQHKPATSPDSEVTCGPLRLDLARRRVQVGDRDVRLTATEYNLLLELAKHPNQVLLHEHLLAAVWGPEYRDDIDYLRAYVRYLRQKIEADPSNPKLIITNPGVGYMLACPDDQ